MTHPSQMSFADVIKLEEAALKLADTMTPEHAAMTRRLVAVLSYHVSVLGDVRRLTEMR